MRKLGGILIISAAVALVGCAADVPPEPTPTALANQAACESFEAATIKVGDAVANSTAIDLDIAATFDTVALKAEGDVKGRILAVVENLPTPAHMIGWMDNRKAYSADLESVRRACAAGGVDIRIATLVAANQG